MTLRLAIPTLLPGSTPRSLPLSIAAWGLASALGGLTCAPTTPSQLVSPTAPQLPTEAESSDERRSISTAAEDDLAGPTAPGSSATEASPESAADDQPEPAVIEHGVRIDEARSMLLHDDEIRYRISEPTIHPTSGPLIKSLAQAIRDNPQIGVIRVEVHTDPRGSNAYNLEMSQRKADALREALIEAGVPPKRLRALGMGESRPITSESADGKSPASRRVELWIHDDGAAVPAER